MSTTTTYDVVLRYTVDNRGGVGPTKTLAAEVDNLSEKTLGLESMLGRVGAAAAGAFGAHELKKHLVDFNSDVQNAKIGLSAMLEGNMGGSWEKATDNANALYTEFQKFSTLTPVTTQDILMFGKSVAVSTFQAGGDIKDLTQITEQGVIAAKAFGYETAYSSLELSEMLAGNVNKRMMFAKQMLGIAKVDEKEFNAMSGRERIGVIEKVLNSDAMKNAAKSFGDSWSGVTSTLEDKLQILAGKVGLPLFKALTKEVQSWSTWIDNNTTKIDAFGHELADGLVTGFTVVKDAVGFLVDHAELLLTIGKVWAAVKIGGMLGGGITGLVGSALGAGGGLAGFFRKAGDRFDPETGGYQYTSAGRGQQAVTMGNIGGNLPLVGAALGAGLAIGNLIHNVDTFDEVVVGATRVHGDLLDITDRTTRKFVALTHSMDAMDEATQRAAMGKTGTAGAWQFTNLGGGAAYFSQRANLIGDLEHAVTDLNKSFSVDGMKRIAELKDAIEKAGISFDEVAKSGGMTSYVADMQRRSAKLQTAEDIGPTVYAGARWMEAKTLGPLAQLVDLQSQNNEMLGYISRTLAAGGTVDPRVVRMMMIREAVENSLKNVSQKPNVNITIQRIEVQSDDPDRYAFGLVEAFRDAVKNPSQAVRQIRGG